MKRVLHLLCVLVVGCVCFFLGRLSTEKAVWSDDTLQVWRSVNPDKAEKGSSPLLERQSQTDFFGRLAEAAFERTKCEVSYVPAYVSLTYPCGDVPADTGVCTDVVIRSYRALGIDLQVKVHEDMKTHFSLYPKKWGLNKPDRNIDHRRVPNLMTFFSRFGTVLPTSKRPSDYKPGDVVAWDFGGGKTHIGIVSNRRSKNRGRYWIIHNGGAGPKLDDDLFSWKIIGHYRYK